MWFNNNEFECPGVGAVVRYFFNFFIKIIKLLGMATRLVEKLLLVEKLIDMYFAYMV